MSCHGTHVVVIEILRCWGSEYSRDWDTSRNGRISLTEYFPFRVFSSIRHAEGYMAALGRPSA